LRSNPGVRRVHAELAALGHHVSSKRVWRLMKAAGLQGRHRKSVRRTTIQGQAAVPAADLIGRDLTAEAPNLRWCGDIKCRRRHLMSYADLRIMPMTSAMVCSGKAFGVVWSA
jgi:transposase InsO family protein